MKNLVDDANAIFQNAVRSVQADQLLGDLNWDKITERSLDAYRHVHVVGMGKAALAMASVVERRLGDRIARGAVVVPHGYPLSLPERFVRPERIEVMEAGHPIPDLDSERAAHRMLSVADLCGEDDLLIVLISGGGTALCASFVDPISLEEAQVVFRMLLHAGADIHEMNAVRKHLSKIGGGHLAEAAYPAEVVSLVISDVTGDELSVIASGPTVPDPTTFQDAIDVLHRYGLWEEVPASIRNRLETGSRDKELENPKPGHMIFDRIRNVLIGSNRTALEAAREEARRRGYETQVQEEYVDGEAREAGSKFANQLKEIESENPVCFLSGGETTVTVRGNGKGGRNMEFTLSAILALDEVLRPLAVLGGGTDGIDGPTDAAGACATQDTLRLARKEGVLPERCLSNNDAYTFFERAGGLVITGPTHTNVMDIQIGLIHPYHNRR